MSSSRQRREAGAPSDWLLAPALVFFTAFALIPLVGVLGLSFASWDGLGPISWAGLANWREVFSNPVTVRAMWLSLLMSLLSYAVQMPLALLLGSWMAGRGRFRNAVSVLYFLPLIFSAAAVGIAFKALLDPNFGMARAFGLSVLQQDWLGDPSPAFFVVVLVISWSFIPFHSLLYQAGVRQTPESMYEAAQIDGANRVRAFFSITVPQLKNTFITSSTLMLVGSLTYFDMVFVMTAGGPGDATRILPLDMYLTGFRSNLMGPASAIAVILVVVGLALSLGLTRLSGGDRMDSQLEGA